MARHRGSRGRNLNIVYIVAVVVAAVVVGGLIYGFWPFGANGDKLQPDSNDAGPGVVGPLESGDASPTPPKEIAETEPDANSLKTGPGVEATANPRADELIAQAEALLGGTPSRIIEARDKLNEALAMPMSLQQQSLVKSKLSILADQWLFSKTFYAQDKLCSSYEVQSGDLLSKIGDEHNVPYELLLEINGIKRPESLRAGERMKVVNGPFHAKVHRSTFTLDVYLQSTYVKSFPVGLGEQGRQTPLGLWHIKAGGKMHRPIYTDPDTGEVIHPEDPAYPLGSRWMALEGLDENTKKETSFGIHGTKDPASIGRDSSRGCIRLHNGDVIKVYNMLVPVKSLVKVLE